MQERFYQLADHLQSRLTGEQVFTAWFEAEDSDFVRFNHGRVRQPGSVKQRSISVDLISGRRQAGGTVTLAAADPTEDRDRLDALLARLRDKLQHVAEDPHLLYSTTVHNTERFADDGGLPKGPEVVNRVLKRADGLDFVGIYAGGPIYRGFANSFGQRNWFTSRSFNLDWSLYARGDKAVKCGYAGFDWDDAELDQKMREATAQLEVLQRPAKTIEPGEYRVYLAPSAVHEFLWLLSWGDFGLKSHRTKSTSLLRMLEEDTKLSEKLSLSENTAQSSGPAFQNRGFLKPDRVDLIVDGELKHGLCSPRSAKEYGVETNGAEASEEPSALDIAPGQLEREDVVAALGTGIYINNLWYLNYSDKPAARITGMTRFATLWVEKGRVVAPVNVMRFDDSLYRILGEKLEELTAEREFMLDANTYEKRSTGCFRLPGALVGGMRLTL